MFHDQWHLRQREQDHGPEKVTDTDADVINLVAMLFDFILDDDNLPIPVKALVGRLQIPLLKVAIELERRANLNVCWQVAWPFPRSRKPVVCLVNYKGRRVDPATRISHHSQ